MMYVGVTPWHGLGTQLNHPPTSAEAIKAAGLDWEVGKFPAYVRYGKEGEFFREVNRKALMPLNRIDSPKCPVFGVVGNDYGIVQNSDAFEFFDPIIEGKQATYETAGALGEGERVWILAKLTESMVIAEGDEVVKYLLLANSHTGAASVQIKLTPVRVVCNNTLTMALSFGESIKIPHFPDVKKRLAFASEVISNVLQNYAMLEKHFVEMARRRLSPDDFLKYMDLVMPVPVPGRNPNSWLLSRIERIKSQRKQCREFFEYGNAKDPEEIRGTLWSAYNAVTYLSDYVMSLPEDMEVSDLDGLDLNERTRPAMEKRLKRLWFGDAATLKVKAYEAAMDMLKLAA